MQRTNRVAFQVDDKEKSSPSEKGGHAHGHKSATTGARDTKARKVSLTSILQRKRDISPTKKDKPAVVNPKRKNADAGTINILLEHANRLKVFDEEKLSLPELETQLILCSDEFDRGRLQKKIRRIQEDVDRHKYEQSVGDLIEKYKALNVQDPKSRPNNHQKSLPKSKGSCPPPEGGSGASIRVSSGLSKYENAEKKELIDEFCRRLNISKAVDPVKLIIDVSKCDFCKGETIISAGILVCEDCGRYAPNGSHEIGHSYKDVSETTYKADFTYKRFTRFKDIVMSFQGRQHKEISEELLEVIRQEIAKTPSTDVATLTVEDIRYYLKKVKRPDSYDQAPAILCNMNKIPPVTLPAEVEEMLFKMFHLIQEPYESVRLSIAPLRKSFLNNFYVLHKFFELMSLPDYQKNFKLLKSKDKLLQHDQLWEAICGILGWKFIPSAKIW